MSHYLGLIERYRERLPVTEGMRIISLVEGDTPLIPLDNLARAAGRDVKIYAKFEGLNPTGSFKDRGMTVAVTQAVHEGTQGVICASTGNTSASAAAYAARAGLRCFVLIPDGKIALGKLAQAMIQGAVVIQIQGNFDDGMRIVKELADAAPIAIVNSINPYRLQGQKTAAFEIVDALGRAPDYHCIPVGNAGNISAYWMGYCEYAGVQTTKPAVCGSRPVMLGYQAAGAAPFLRGAPVADPETVATAIRIGNPQSWDLAWAAVRESGGCFAELTDEEILAAQKLLAEREGVFCEPASAIAVGGLLRDIEAGKIAPGSVVTCTLTGHGLKDPDTAIKQSQGQVLQIRAETELVKRAILDRL
ncbi:MAG TPA: threonine synthase [Gammaproteobacteria bacterium]|nr:threonine synthase [Gammaproteobacteria bacterium]